jgi:hypothetical protein
MRPSFEKALNTVAGSGGDALIPRLADQIIPYIRQKSYMRQFLPSFVMPTQVYRFPKLTAGSNVYYVGEQIAAPEAVMTTGTVELTAKKLMVALAISAELQEDAILPIVPVVRDDMAKAFALAEEDVFINGDTAGAFAVNDPKYAFDGLRKIATATDVDATSAALTLANISSSIQNLDVFGRDKSELLLVVSLREENRLRQLLGINLAVNALGLTGTALPGEIGKVWGVPVVATNLLPTTLGMATNQSVALMINRNAAVIGDRRIFSIKSSDEVLIRSDQLLIVASERIAFAAQYAQAVCKIINIAP